MTTLKADIITAHKTPASIAALSSEVCGCPRDIIRLLRDRNDYMVSLHQAVDMLDDIHHLKSFLTDPSSFEDLSHCLVLVEKQERDQEPDDMRNDWRIFSVKGTLASELLWTRLSTLKIDNAPGLVHICSSASPYDAGLAGYVFENAALRLISGLCPPTNVLSLKLFAPMNQEQEEGNGKFPYHFVYNLYSQTPTCPPPSPSRLPNILMEIERYRRLDDSIVVTPGKCYVAIAPNNPLFNAFFYEVITDRAGCASHVVLWIIRTTVSKTHDGVATGFREVKTLVKKAAALNDSVPVEVKYVLVVPDTLKKETVCWAMAKEFDDAPGNVYVQFAQLGYSRTSKRECVRNPSFV